MASQGIHVERIDDMSTDAFINSLRCLTAIRGPVGKIQTDRGTNLGSANKLQDQIKAGKLTKFTAYNDLEFVTMCHMPATWGASRKDRYVLFEQCSVVVKGAQLSPRFFFTPNTNL